jgi:serine/threonine-protein kinase
MGVVWKARQRKLNRLAALKMVLGEQRAGSKEMIRFLAEAEAAAAVKHPHVVQVYEYGEADGRPFLAMEYLPGGSLADWLHRKGRLDPKAAAALVATLAGAVQAAHDLGIVHRDLKPGNVLFDERGQPKVADFGLAKRAGGSNLTATQAVMGTPGYMAPEQARGNTKFVGPQADVYSLGVILYHCLTGTRPFEDPDPVVLLRKVAEEEPERPGKQTPGLPGDLETICLKCLSKEMGHRYASARALADDLLRFGGGRPIQARPVGWAERSWRWCRRNPPAAALAAALLALVVLAVGSGLWLGRRDAVRQGRAREAVEAALAQVPGLRRQGRWPEVEAVLTQARSRLDEAGSDDLRRRLARADKDLQLAAALERIRLTPAIEGSRFDYRGMAKSYAQAFEQAGLDIWGDEEAVAARIRSSDLRPHLVMALDHWAYVTDALGDRQAMARLLDLARRVDPDPQWGDCLRAPGVWGNQEALWRLAADLPKRLAKEATENGPPTPLVTLLAKRLGQQDGKAEPLLRAAQGRHPEDFWLNYALGEALRERKPAEAVGFYRAALATRPTVAPVHFEVGVALWRQGQWDEAMTEIRRATDLEPTGAHAHYILGACCLARGRLDEAMTEFRRTIELEPKGAPAHFGLGRCRLDKGRLDLAVAEFRRTIELDPGGGLGYENLAEALLRSGRFAEARTTVRHSLDVLPPQEPRLSSLREKQELCERMLALDARLLALFQGKERPAAAEQLELARLCREYGRPYAAASLYTSAFTARPELADDLGSGYRYSAARAAARAAADMGTDEARLGELERASLRSQALDWLRADLALGTRLLNEGKGLGWSLDTSQTEPDLVSVRDQAELAKLPAAEREQWQHLWADVAALRATDPLEEGRAFAAHRDWTHAANRYSRTLAGDPMDDDHFWFEYAALLLLSGNRPGYARVCARMIEASGKAGGPRAYLVTRACTLAPDAVAEASLPGRLAEKELQGSGREFWSLTEQGALAYRAGRFQQSVPLFEQSLQADARPGRAVINWLWLALAQERLGKAEEARRWLDKAQAWLDQYGDGLPARADEELGLHLHNWLEAHVLRREAEALIPSTVPRSAKENKERGERQK